MRILFTDAKYLLFFFLRGWKILVWDATHKADNELIHNMIKKYLSVSFWTRTVARLEHDVISS